MNTNKKTQKKMSLQQINKITLRMTLRKQKQCNLNHLRFNTNQKNIIYGKLIANMNAKNILTISRNSQLINIREKTKLMMIKTRRRIFKCISITWRKMRNNSNNLTPVNKHIEANRIAKILHLKSISPKKNSL